MSFGGFGFFDAGQLCTKILSRIQAFFLPGSERSDFDANWCSTAPDFRLCWSISGWICNIFGPEIGIFLPCSVSTVDMHWNVSGVYTSRPRGAAAWALWICTGAYPAITHPCRAVLDNHQYLSCDYTSRPRGPNPQYLSCDYTSRPRGPAL